MRLSLQSLRKEMRYGAIEEEQISQNLVVATGTLEEAVGQKKKKKKYIGFETRKPELNSCGTIYQLCDPGQPA